MKNMQQTLTLHNHRFIFTDFPRHISMDTYDKVRQWLVAHLSGCLDVVSVYEAGTVSQPGISDLDFLVVLSGSFSRAGALLFEQSGWPDEVNGLIAGGTILKTSAHLFPILNKIDNFQLTLLHGEALRQSENTEKLPFINLCRLLDWLPERVMSLTRTLVTREVHLIRQLGLLKSILLSFRMFVKECGLMGDECGTFGQNITALRANWFDDEKTSAKLKKVIEYSLQALSIGQEMLAHLENHVQKEGLIKDSGVNDAVFRLNDSLCFHFSKEFKAIKPLKFINDTGISSFALTIPAGLFPYFAVQGLGKGIISRRLYKNMHPAPKDSYINYLNKDLYRTIRERMEICNSNASFLEERGITTGLLKYGWFLKSREAADAGI